MTSRLYRVRDVLGVSLRVDLCRHAALGAPVRLRLSVASGSPPDLNVRVVHSLTVGGGFHVPPLRLNMRSERSGRVSTSLLDGRRETWHNPRAVFVLFIHMGGTIHPRPPRRGHAVMCHSFPRLRPPQLGQAPPEFSRQQLVCGEAVSLRLRQPHRGRALYICSRRVRLCRRRRAALRAFSRGSCARGGRVVAAPRICSTGSGACGGGVAAAPRFCSTGSCACGCRVAAGTRACSTASCSCGGRVAAAPRGSLSDSSGSSAFGGGAPSCG